MWESATRQFSSYSHFPKNGRISILRNRCQQPPGAHNHNSVVAAEIGTIEEIPWQQYNLGAQSA